MTSPTGDAFVTGLTDRQLQVLEVRGQSLMIEILTQVADRYADLLEVAALRHTLTAADDPTVAAPPPVDPQDLAGIAASTSAAIGQTMLPLVAEVYMSGASRTRAQMIDAVPGAIIPPIHNAQAEAYLRIAAPAFAGIGPQLWQNVRTGLADGFAAGDSIPELADRVRAAAGVSSRTATLVARTSVIDAANGGSITTARASGLEMEKEWMATPDRRTRPTHRTADGQRVPLHGKFVVGGYECDHPGDRTLPSSERDLCRCTQGYIIPERERQKHAGPETGRWDRTPQEGRVIRSTVRDAETTVPISEEFMREGGVLAQPASAPTGAASNDPAFGLTVDKLRSIARANGVQFSSRAGKLELVETMRDWEMANGSLPDMPPAPPLPNIGRVELPDPQSPIIIGTSPTGLWDDLLPAGDSPPGGYWVSRVRAFQGAGKPYIVDYGIAYRTNGVAYLIETPNPKLNPLLVAQQAEIRHRALQAVHDSVMGAERANRSYMLALRRSPDEAYWAAKYNRPMDIAAQAGRGEVFIWRPSNIDRGVIQHETGHNLDRGYQAGGSRSPEWRAAVAADEKAAIEITGFVPKSPNVSGAHANDFGHSHTSPTEYAGASEAEDYAESLMLYSSQGSLGYGFLPGVEKVTEIYFRDVYPNRAALFDRMFAKTAKRQAADIAALGRKASPAAPSPVRPTGDPAKRAAARTRQAAIDKASARADALTEIDEVVGMNAEGAAAIIDARLAYSRSKGAITAADETAIRKALATGDRAKVTATLDRLAGRGKVRLSEQIGGQVTKFDAATMRTVGGGLPAPGTRVKVVTRGSTLDYDGEAIQLERTLVREVDDAEIAAADAATVAAKKQSIQFLSAVERDLANNALTAERVTAFARRAGIDDATRDAFIKAAYSPAKARTALAAALKREGLKREGVPGRGAQYDPEWMEPPFNRTALAEVGGRVKIREPAYVTEIDGRRVVVTKATTDVPAFSSIRKMTPEEFAAADLESQGQLSILAVDDVRKPAKALAKVLEDLDSEVDDATLRLLSRSPDVMAAADNPALAPVLKAIAAGDRTKLRAAVATSARRLGLRETEQAGAIVKMQKGRHEDVDGAAGNGQTVRVIAPGYRWTDPLGNDMQLTKALVERADAADIARLDAEAVKVANDFLDANPTATAAALKKAGISKIGKASKTPVAYDPAMHEIRGDLKPAPGVKVRVVEPGYYVKGAEGEAVLVRRPLAEIVEPTTPAGRATKLTIPEQRGPQADYQRRVAEVASRPDAAVADSRPLGGSVGGTHLVTFADGKQQVRKHYVSAWRSASETKAMTDAEPLGAAVLDATGVRAPGVVVRPGGRIDMEFLSGEAFAETHKIPILVADSDDARLMGLMDYITANTDRNSGNILMRADGHLAGIDHGYAFQYDPRITGTGLLVQSGSDFMGYLSAPGGVLRKIIDLNPADLAVIRARLEALRPMFAEAGRDVWYRQMMRRFAAVEKRADPKAKIRLPEAKAVEIVDATYAARQEKLRELARSGTIVEQRPLMGGSIADVTLLTYDDGSKLVFKMSHVGDFKRSADAEELAARVLDALGMRAPAVARAGNAVSMEYMVGSTGAELGLRSPGDPLFRRLIDSKDGQLLGLADALLGNTDRNTGNWMRLTGSTRLAAIDHGNAFRASRIGDIRGSNPFAQYLFEPGLSTALAGSLPISRRQLANARSRLEGLLPEFERLGRLDWHVGMMRRLTELEGRATLP